MRISDWSSDVCSSDLHQIAGADDDEDEAAVLIAPPEVDAPLRPLVINLRDAAVEGSFERVLEVVPADDGARGPLRERWKQYKARGLDVHKYDMCTRPGFGIDRKRGGSGTRGSERVAHGGQRTT